MARTIDPRTRPALLEAAEDLFYERGIATTGVDDVAARSGLSKPTFYRHFPSKDAIVAAYLAARHEQLGNELGTWLEGLSPNERPTGVIDWICDWICRPGFRGCAFVRAQAELLGNEDIRTSVRLRKSDLLETIESACYDASLREPSRTAEQLALIVEGATTMAFATGDSAAAVSAAQALGRAAIAAAANHNAQ